MSRTIMMVIAAAFILAPATGRAQRAEQIQQGARVRVSTQGNLPHVGYLSSLTSDTVALRRTGQVPDSSNLNIGRDRVTSLEVRGRSHFRGALKGAGIGLLAGALSGIVLGAATFEKQGTCWVVCSAPDAAMIAGVLGAIIGTPAGLVIGGIQGTGTWRRVDPDSVMMR